MTPRIRLGICAAMIILSAGYAVLVSKNVEVAKATALGYIALMLTLLVILNVWKKP